MTLYLFALIIASARIDVLTSSYHPKFHIVLKYSTDSVASVWWSAVIIVIVGRPRRCLSQIELPPDPRAKSAAVINSAILFVWIYNFVFGVKGIRRSISGIHWLFLPIMTSILIPWRSSCCNVFRALVVSFVGSELPKNINILRTFPFRGSNDLRAMLNSFRNRIYFGPNNWRQVLGTSLWYRFFSW